MFDPAQTALLPAPEVARTTPLATARNSIRWASYGFTEVPSDTLEQIVEAVPPTVADALKGRAYYFVPLAIGEPQGPSFSSDVANQADDSETAIAPGFSDDLSDRATCHRTLLANGVESTFISARLMQDKFALAFEFFINISHHFVDAGSIPERLRSLLWSQMQAGVRGETSQDAYEARARASDAAATRKSVALFPSHLAQTGLPETAVSVADAAEPAQTPAAPDAPPSPAAGFGMVLSGAAGSAPVQSMFAAVGNKLGRKRSIEPHVEPGKAHVPAEDPASSAFYEAAFADALAIYMLSLTLDLDYADLREREYPLLAAPALADRLRLIADLYPPPPAYEFAIRYRRRH